MTTTAETIRRNYQSIGQRIDAACERAGRDPDSVTLIAVVKYARWEWVQTLVKLGVVDLGESRPQQLVERRSLLADDIRWHLIGHLQRNKIRKVLAAAALIHSIDSLKLLEAVNRVAAEEKRMPRVLLQVNVSGEASKGGFAPAELQESWESVAACTHVRVAGLMTMAPESRDLVQAREVFAGLRELREVLLSAGGNGITLPELSMGMSGDFEVAIEEGATLVRVGSSLFEGLEA